MIVTLSLALHDNPAAQPSLLFIVIAGLLSGSLFGAIVVALVSRTTERRKADVGSYIELRDTANVARVALKVWGDAREKTDALNQSLLAALGPFDFARNAVRSIDVRTAAETWLSIGRAYFDNDPDVTVVDELNAWARLARVTGEASRKRH